MVVCQSEERKRRLWLFLSASWEEQLVLEVFLMDLDQSEERKCRLLLALPSSWEG